MRFFIVSLILLSIFSGCRKWTHGHKDTKFRNKFVGTYRIDSIVKKNLQISDSGIVKDTNYTVYSLTGDYLEILHTKDQIEKNVTCQGKFLDSVFRYEVQGFKDKNADRLSFTYCNDCQYSEIFNQHILGSRYVISNSDNRLILETRFTANDKPFGTKLYLSKK